MKILNAILQGFLLPGTLVIQWIGFTVEEDGGIVRSFVNMCFWGTIVMAIALKYWT